MKNLQPLRKKYANGNLYERRPETEILIHKCLDLPFDQLHEYAQINLRTHSDYIPSEVLVHIIRQTKADNTDARFNAIYELLTSRIKGACPRSEVQGNGDLAESLDIQDFVLDDFSERIVLDRQEYGKKLDMYECSFDLAIVRRKHDAMRKTYRRDKPTVPLEYDEDGDVSSEVEKSLAQLSPDENSLANDINYRFDLQAAIDTLTGDEKRVINMIFAGIPTESTDPDVPTISTLLECEPKTVRNRRARALKKLKAILGTETNHVG